MLKLANELKFFQSVDLRGNRVKNVGLAVDGTDLMPKSQVTEYVDTVAQGLNIKFSVRAATTENITLSGLQTIDGIVLAEGDRVLVKNQTDKSENGIYDVVDGAWTRSADFDGTPEHEVQGGCFTFVQEGTENGDSGWVVITNGIIDVGVDDMEFEQFSGAGQVTAGAALSKTGNRLDVNVDDDSIEVSEDALRVKSVDAEKADVSNLETGNFKEGAIVTEVANASDTTLPTEGAVKAYVDDKKYVATITGDGTTEAFTLTHNLGTEDVLVQVREAATKNVVYPAIATTSENVVTVTFTPELPLGEEYKVVIMG